MQIQTNCHFTDYRNNSVCPKINYNQRVGDTVSFTGHAQTEKVFCKGFKQLIHQTAFNREPQTKEFVCDYIRKNFGGKDRIKIVSGGCSTGEEPVTYSMRLYDMRDKVDILGIDLGKDAIKQANSRKFIFETPSNNFDFFEEYGIPSPYTDTYLISDKASGLTPSEQHFKALFKEFFEPTGEKIKTPFLERLRNQIIRRMLGVPLELERTSYRLKDGKAENCKFIQGDINDIEKIMNGEKADVISFSNALYHLTTTSFGNGMRVPNKDMESITEKLMTKFKNCLNDGGIVVFGEDEGAQLLDYDIVPKVMKKLGFKPMNKTKSHAANVWCLDK